MPISVPLETIPIKRTPFQNFWRTFSRNRMGLVGVVALIAIILVALFAPALAPYDPYSSAGINSSDIYQPPSPEHPFGTDDAGKDELSLFVYGARSAFLPGSLAAGPRPS
jgi:peptide/nickel transport system permease protein